MADATVTIRPQAPIGTISPRLYGHFGEHLGRCCYGGLWVGPDSPIGNDGGFRRDVVAALRGLPVPLLRWPGGCYADHYHWRDGVGPPSERPRRLGMSCGLQVTDDNGHGTDEFLHFCALLGAEPYLAGNVGSGTPQELCDWVEYCNAVADTALANERAANGHPAAYGVRLWGVGNENWGCGGNFDAATYAREYRRYATMLRHVDPAAELVACGHDDAWNATFLETVGDKLGLVDHLSIHDYWFTGGPELGFDADDYYRLLAAADATEAFVARTAAMAWEASGPRDRPIGIALDEWGVWHPEARRGGTGVVPGRDPVTYEQANTLRDALAAAIALEGFHRRCGVLSLANLAQVVNVLQAPVMTDGDRCWLTPTYHAFRLHAPHIGAVALPVELAGPLPLPDGAPAVTATASRAAAGLAFTLINRHRDQAADVRLVALRDLGAATAEVLTADSPRATNDVDAPDRVAPAPLPVAADGLGGWRLTLPPHSLATVLLGASAPAS